MRNRGCLHVNKLRQYAEYCAGLGWKEEPVKGDYEVLRMRHPKTKDPLIVYRRDRRGGSRVHYIVWGIGEELFYQWIREEKRRFKEQYPEIAGKAFAGDGPDLQEEGDK